MENQSREIGEETRMLAAIFRDAEIYAENHRLRRQRNLSLWLNAVLFVAGVIMYLTGR